LCILVGLGYAESYFGISFAGAADPEHDITVMSFNIGGLRYVQENGNQGKIARVKAEFEDFVERHGKPDILCIQEGNLREQGEVLRKAFGFTHYFRHKGTVIFSNYPFVKQDLVPFKSTSNSCVWADLKTPNGIVRVYSAHLQSNALSYTANKIVTEGDLGEKNTWRDIRFVMRRYKNAVAVRAEQTMSVKKHIDQSPHPVILCGDLNDTPVSYVYRCLTENLQDSFREKGAGFGFTFNGNPPGLRIDYILADPEIQIKDHRVPRVGISDHFPVWARLSLRGT
jgi:endonuclease/exonuclease/phosphatase family metal-dependent hydrolase